MDEGGVVRRVRTDPGWFDGLVGSRSLDWLGGGMGSWVDWGMDGDGS